MSKISELEERQQYLYEECCICQKTDSKCLGVKCPIEIELKSNSLTIEKCTLEYVKWSNAFVTFAEK